LEIENILTSGKLTRHVDRKFAESSKAEKDEMDGGISGENRLPTAGKKTARCDPFFVQQLIAKHKLIPRPFQGVPDEVLSLLDDPEQQKLRKILARRASQLKESRDWEKDIIQQFHAKGYAEYEIDDEEEEK
jgi:hypothetical protein